MVHLCFIGPVLLKWRFSFSLSGRGMGFGSRRMSVLEWSYCADWVRGCFLESPIAVCTRCGSSQMAVAQRERACGCMPKCVWASFLFCTGEARGLSLCSLPRASWSPLFSAQDTQQPSFLRTKMHWSNPKGIGLNIGVACANPLGPVL